MALTDKLTAVADAIRAKTGGTEAMTLDQMPTKMLRLKQVGAVLNSTSPMGLRHRRTQASCG